MGMYWKTDAIFGVRFSEEELKEQDFSWETMEKIWDGEFGKEWHYENPDYIDGIFIGKLLAHMHEHGERNVAEIDYSQLEKSAINDFLEKIGLKKVSKNRIKLFILSYEE